MQKDTYDLTVFFHFLDLCKQKMLNKRWWNWSLVREEKRETDWVEKCETQEEIQKEIMCAFAYMRINLFVFG